MKKIYLLLSLLLFGKSYAQIKLQISPDSIINQMAAGFGCNTYAMLDSVPVVCDKNCNYRSWGGSAWGATPEASDTKAWDKIYEYMDWLGMDYTRLNLEHRVFEPEKGKFSFDNREMQVLYKQLDYFEKKGTIVQLQEMYPNAKWLAHKELQSNAVDIVKSGPADLEAWSDGIIALLKHLIGVKKYTCIKYFGIANEPHHGWSWWKNSDGKTSQYIVPALDIMKKKLLKNKLNIPLTGPEEMFYHWEAKNTQINFSPYVDAFSYHEYMTTIDWWDAAENKDWYPTLKSFTEPLRNAVTIAHKQKKPFFFAEHGTMHFGILKDARGPSTFSAVMKDVEFAVRYANLGVDGFSRWSLLNRGNLDGQWGFIETFDRSKLTLLQPDKYTPKENTFYGYGMLTRFTYKNSYVVKTTIKANPTDSSSHLFAAAFLSPSQADVTIYIVNDKQINSNLELNLDMNIAKYKKWYKYEFSIADRNKTDVKIDVIQELASKNTTALIKGNSIVVYSTKKLNHDDVGLVSE